jgi:hypothetical protein
MQTLLIVWRLLLTASIFVFPLLLTLLLYYRLGRAPRWVTAIAVVLAPAIFFVFLAPIFLFAGVREAQARGDGECGMPAMAAVLFLYAGTALELGLGLLTVAFLTARRRRASATTT